MAIVTLLEFATDKTLTRLLVKERVKQRSRNRSDKKHALDKECDLFELTSTRKQLSRLMPPRRFWVHPRKRISKPKDSLEKRKNVMKAVLHTIARDKMLQKQGFPLKPGQTLDYLDEQQAFFARIRSLLASDSLEFQSPSLLPIFKDFDKKDKQQVICRPLSVYSRLEDKIILGLTSLYLTRYFDAYLHENILSYRPLRSFGGEKRVTDFNDGVKLVLDYLRRHPSQPIYAADCDIKKFYDIIPHQVVEDCFDRLLDKSSLSEQGRAQVMRVVKAYLKSYNFYTNAWHEAEQHDYVYYKVRRRLHDAKCRNTYRIDWPQELGDPQIQTRRGVPQGGALSLLIANIVLNDVDHAVVQTADPNRLFVRYCDDMILLHTDYNECERLMEAYTQSLTNHGLIFHPFKHVSDCSRRDFWGIKSHCPFLWGEGDGNSNRYIGFLGYEIRRNGNMRLRKSNIKRVDEKFERMKYALRRFCKKHTEEEYNTYRDRKVKNVLESFEIYSALDQARFEAGKQFGHVKKLADTIKRREYKEQPNQ